MTKATAMYFPCDRIQSLFTGTACRPFARCWARSRGVGAEATAGGIVAVRAGSAEGPIALLVDSAGLSVAMTFFPSGSLAVTEVVLAIGTSTGTGSVIVGRGLGNSGFETTTTGSSAFTGSGSTSGTG